MAVVYHWKRTRIFQLLAVLGLMLYCWKVFVSLSPGDDDAKVGTTKNSPDSKELRETILDKRKKNPHIGLVHVDGIEVDLGNGKQEMDLQVGVSDEGDEDSDYKPNNKNLKFQEDADIADGKDKISKAVFMPNKIGNYEPTDTEPRTGFGENGIGVQLDPADEAKYRESVSQFGFNMVISDKISLDRAVKDIRDPECKYWHYPEELPRASVVIVFINEGWSTLMRTVHSVINTSPPHLLAEIVMVDDFSDKEHLGKRLDDYIAQPKFKDKVKLVRNEKREGLIRSRTIGALNAERGEVVIFLDAHCECNINWLPPLLARIKEDRTNVVCPMVDSIHAQTYEYRAQGGGMARGVFNWDFYYKRIPIPDREIQRRRTNSEPYRSPVMAGGLFALSRSFFLELGGYDPGLDIWGGEQYEISFKIWMCGGSLEFVPCSRVGHVYRMGGLPYSYPKPDSDDGVSIVNRNYLRVAEVWMDEYKEYFYRMKPDLRGKRYGDIGQQKQMRQEKCPHSFKWFMEEVAYDIVESYPLPAENVAWGEVEATGSRYCLDNRGKTGGAKIALYRCHGYGGSQLYRLNKAGEFRVNEECLYADNKVVRQQRCVPHKEYGWDYDESISRITVKVKGGILCMDHNGSYQEVVLLPCQDDKATQKWTFQPLN